MVSMNQPVFKAFGEEILLSGINMPDRVTIKHSVPEICKDKSIRRTPGSDDDFAIKVGKLTFYGEKELLKARIPYFRALFSSNLIECTKGDIDLTDVSHESIVEQSLDYAATGRITITTRNVQELMIAANFFQIELVVDECAKFIRRRLRLDNIISIFYFYKSIGYDKINSHILNFIDTNFVPLSTTKEFRNLAIDDLADILLRDTLHVDEEKQVFEAVNRWIRNDSDRKVHAVRLLKCVRCTLLEDTFIRKTVARAKWVRGSKECISLINEAKNHVTNNDGQFSSFITTGRYCENAHQLFLSLDVVGAKTENPLMSIDIYDPIRDCWFEGKRYSVPCAPNFIRLRDNKLFLSCKREVFEIIDTVTNERHTGKDYIEQNKPKRPSLFPIEGRTSPAAAWIKGKAYAAGGKGVNGESLSTAIAYDVDTKEWSPLAPMSKARFAPAFWARHGKLYVVGGRDATGQHLSDGECYDPETHSWTSISSMKFKRRSAEEFSLHGQSYVMGGYDGKNAVTTLERYDTATDTWTTLAEMKTGRYCFSVGSSCGKIFVFGGFDSHHGAKVCTSVEMYDPETNVWEARQDLPITTNVSCAFHFPLSASLPTPVFNAEEFWINRFRRFALKDELFKAICDCNYRHPPKLLTECLPPALEGRNIFLQSKNLFSTILMQVIAVLQQLQPVDGEISALFLCTTRDHTEFTGTQIEKLSKYFETVRAASFTGGASIKKDAGVLKEKQPHIVIGTPARIHALAQSGSLDLNNIKHIAVDDADLIIRDNGIIIDKIFKAAPQKKQVLMSTDSLSNQLRRFCDKFMQNKPRRFEYVDE